VVSLPTKEDSDDKYDENAVDFFGRVHDDLRRDPIRCRSLAYVAWS
jgi:hypothetical protein